MVRHENVSGNTEIYFEPEFGVLICKAHGYGIPPTRPGVTRHLRGKKHRYGGQKLKQAVFELMLLPVSSLQGLCNATPTFVRQPIPYLNILEGWKCVHCLGQFLTTSQEMLQRHLAAEHSVTLGDISAWYKCKMQTFFQETKHRKYFEVEKPAGLHHKCRPIRGYIDGCSTTDQGRMTPPTSSSRKVTDSEFHERAPEVSRALQLHHPFASIANGHVRGLSLSHLDQLFKSPAFHFASEPLFDPRHVDAGRSMQVVFPGCHENSLFYNALVCSMLQSEDYMTSKAKADILHSKAIHLLQETLRAPLPKQYSSVAGAIMILRSSAFKFHDFDVYDIHANGLRDFIRYHGQGVLTSAAKRALFWQDLYAAMFYGSDDSIDPEVIFDKVSWPRETESDHPRATLPAGFFRRQQVLPSALLDCVVDVLELRTTIQMLDPLPFDVKHPYLESMQASIESRLVALGRTSENLEPVVEAARLTTLMCCHCLWSEVWIDRPFSCKMSEKVFDLLEPTVDVPAFQVVWGDNLDILLWLLYILTNLTRLDRGHVYDLKLRRDATFLVVRGSLRVCPVEEVKRAVHEASHDFI